VSARLDFTDEAAVAKWLVALHVAIDDADAIVVDMFRRPAQRELGRRKHRAMYRDAMAGVKRLLDYATPEPDGGETPDAAGVPPRAGLIRSWPVVPRWHRGIGATGSPSSRS
jgi:hypothetical protein